MHEDRDEEEGRKSHRRKDIRYEEERKKDCIKNAKLKGNQGGQ